MLIRYFIILNISKQVFWKDYLFILLKYISNLMFNVQSFILENDANMASKVHVGLCHPIHVYTLMKKKLSRKLSVLK